MKNLASLERFCILEESYFASVMKVANLWVKVPYNSAERRQAWYWDGLHKVMGYLITGFKMEMKSKIQSQKTNDFIDFMADTPVITLFVPDHIYQNVCSVKTKACIVTAGQYGTVKTRACGHKVTSFCLVVIDFVKEVSDEELHRIKSVDDFIVGV